MLETIKNILINESFLKAIVSTIALILLGFILKKKKVFNDTAEKVISSLVVNLGIPCLAFVAFMTDFDESQIENGFIILILALILYLIFFFIGNLLFKKSSKPSRHVFTCIFMLSQVTLFALPIAEMLFGDDILIYINILSIVFRFILYGYALPTIREDNSVCLSKREQRKKFWFAPVITAMFIGFLIWISQPIAPKVNINGIYVSIFRIDKTLSPIYYPIYMLKSITTPLAMILIGIGMANSTFSNAFKNKIAWLLAMLRSFVAPFIAFLLYELLVITHIIEPNKLVLATLVLCFGAPVSAILATFSIQYNQESYNTTNACFLSTLLSIINIPGWVCLLMLW